MTATPDQLRELTALCRELGIVRLKNGDVELMLGPDPAAAKARAQVEKQIAKDRPVVIRVPLDKPTQTSAGGNARSDEILFRSGAR